LENGGPTIWWNDILESIDGIAYHFKLYFLFLKVETFQLLTKYTIDGQPGMVTQFH
jgi:hypothetical protein